MSADQLDLFDPALRPLARLSDPDTSHGAAVIAIHQASGNRLLALRALVSAGDEGLTDFELAAVTGVGQTSIGKRRLELCQAGYAAGVFDTAGRQLRRPSPTGTPSLVWAATPDGIARLNTALTEERHRA